MDEDAGIRAGARAMTADQLHEEFTRIWRSPPGWRALSAVNHSTVGMRFIATGLAFFLVAGLLAMLIRSQLAWSGNEIVSAAAYNQLFTMHGTTMMFLFAVPIAEGFAIYLVPKMLGARDLPLPRLGAYGYWCYLFGGLLLYSSFLLDAAPDSGWFMYVPLTQEAFAPGLRVDFWLLGITFVEISAVSAAVELIVAILKTRAPGMTLARMPLFVWSILVTAFMILFAFPPLIMGSVFLELERAFGFVFFEAARGGDPLLWQHLFWIFGHPEVYIILLPAVGAVSTIVVAFAGRPQVAHEWAVLALIGIGFLSFGLWVHHMFTVGIPLLASSFFSAASMAVTIPSGILIFGWIATLWGTRPKLDTPLLYVLGFGFIFVLGGLTGVMVAFVPFDWQAHDTHFVVAHMHYVLVGGVVFPVFAALYYWLPLAFGRLNSRSLGTTAFWLQFTGVHVTFLPMHFTGLYGLPRRVYTYSPLAEWEWLNLISTVGGFITAAGVGAMIVDIVLHVFYGDRERRNPWNAGTLEWAIRPGVPPYNFASLPRVEDREPLWREPSLPRDIERGQFLLADPGSGRRETLGTSVTRAQPEEVICLSGNSWWPFIAALCTALFFIGTLARQYAVALAGVGLSAVSFLCWAWTTGDRHAPDRIDAGGGLALPLQTANPNGPGWWATTMTLLLDGAAFASVLFSYFFLWAVKWPQWEPLALAGSGWSVPSWVLALTLAGSVVMQRSLALIAAGRPGASRLAMAVGAALGLSLMALQVFEWQTRLGVEREQSAYASLVHLMFLYHLIHLAVALLFAAFAWARARAGYLGQHRPLEGRCMVLFWHYTSAVWIVSFCVIYVLPRIGGIAG